MKQTEINNLMKYADDMKMRAKRGEETWEK